MIGKKNFLGIFLAFTALMPVFGREFVHPGVSYTEEDFTRMRNMVEEGRQPYSTTYKALLESPYSSLSAGVANRGNAIGEGQFNGTVGADGRRAHDLALIWKINGDRRYADKAVEILNANSYYTNTSSRGTGPLDNGKIYLMIEAAEMLRDYSGWSPVDQQRFRDMLVYPYYTSSENLYDRYASLDDEANGITFYWNIFNFDCGRYGNQGLFAARAMMAMGIYLDNERIYDRALRYLLDMPHRSDDLAYPAGPPRLSDTPLPFHNPENPEEGDDTTPYQTAYRWLGADNHIEDYGYDEQLCHYIYPSGQTQEASRDQDHALVGVGLLSDIAEMAWNQGDDFYGAADNRLLKGIEWTFRYNVSYLQDPVYNWQPAFFTDRENDVTFDNDGFLQIRCRSGRWSSVAPSPKGRGDSYLAGGNREQMLAHYMMRRQLPEKDYEWLKEYRNYMMDHFGYESYGKDANHRYEWKGWGSLTKRLDPLDEPQQSAVEEIEVSETVDVSNEPVAIYDLFGRKVKAMTPGNIYVQVLADGKTLPQKLVISN